MSREKKAKIIKVFFFGGGSNQVFIGIVAPESKVLSLTSGSERNMEDVRGD